MNNILPPKTRNGARKIFELMQIYILPKTKISPENRPFGPQKELVGSGILHMDHPKDQPLCLVVDFQGTTKPMQVDSPRHANTFMLRVPWLAYKCIYYTHLIPPVDSQVNKQQSVSRCSCRTRSLRLSSWLVLSGSRARCRMAVQAVLFVWGLSPWMF